MKLLAIDPGGMNGVAWWDEDNYQLAGFNQVKIDDFTIWLENHVPKPDVIVIEDFRLRKGKALQQSGSNMPASQVIGMVDSYCKRNGIKMVKQPAYILATAVQMSQMPLPKDHSKSHWVSAYNHGFWYLVQNGYRKVDLGDLS